MREKGKWTENKYVVLLLITGAVYFFLRYISPLVTPVIIAGMFLTLCYPTFDDIQKKTRIKKQYLASGILLLICGFLIVLLWWGASFLLKEIPVWIDGMDEAQQNVRVLVQNCCRDIGGFLRVDTEGLTNIFLEQIDIFTENFQVQLLPGAIGESWVYIRQLFSVIAVLAVTMIATVLLARDYDTILSFMGAQSESRMVLEIVLKVIRYLATFMKAQFLIMLSVAAVCVGILFFSGVENGILFGILAGILDALPFIGTGIVLLPLALWQFLSGYYWKALFCVIAYILCALLREFMEPRLIGRRVGLYPVAVLIAIYAGLKLFGIWGIVKGPIGLVMIQQTYAAYGRLVDGRRQMNYDKKEKDANEESE